MNVRVNCSRNQIDNLIKQVEQEVYDDAVQACEDNNAIFLLALNNEFKFGPKRIQKLINAFNKLSADIIGMRKDGFTKKEIHETICKQLESIEIDPELIYSEKKDFQQVIRNKKKAEEPVKPSRAEAETAVEHMKAFRNFLVDHEDKAAN